MPVLAAAGEWLALWQLPVFLGLAGAWVFLGGYLLRRHVRSAVGRREGELNRCRIVAFLAGIAGAVAGGMAAALAYLAAHGLNVLSIYLALPAMVGVFCLVSYLTVYASFQLPARRIGMVWLRAFGPSLVLAVVAGVPSVWVANSAHQNRLANFESLNDLHEIHAKIARYPISRPPASLEEMREDKVLAAKYFKARRHPSREIGYFYMPATLIEINAPTKKLLACDWADNQSGGERVVLFVNGRINKATARTFESLLAEPENKAFAKALAEAEKKLLAGSS